MANSNFFFYKVRTIRGEYERMLSFAIKKATLPFLLQTVQHSINK